MADRSIPTPATCPELPGITQKVGTRADAAMPLPEILLWTTPSEPPRALQASECSELLDPTRASCLILAQRQPGKYALRGVAVGVNTNSPC